MLVAPPAPQMVKEEYPCCLADGSGPAVSNEVVSADDSSQVAAPDWRQQAKIAIEDPLVMYELLEGPSRNKTWLLAVPQDAVRLPISHVNDLFANV